MNVRIAELDTRNSSPGGFYVLDEPEAALSPRNQVRALDRIRELAQGGAQFLIREDVNLFRQSSGVPLATPMEPPIARIMVPGG